MATDRNLVRVLRRPKGLTLTTVMFAVVTSMTGCDEGETTPSSQEATPLLGALELPVSLRRTDKAAPGAVLIEVSPSELRAAGESIVVLEAGIAPTSALEGPEIKALKRLVKGQKAIALELHAATPYRTIAQVLTTASTAGIAQVSFKVRGNGAPDQQGYVSAAFTVGKKAKDDAAEDPAADSKRTWDDFVAAWEAVEAGCREAMSGDCAYKPTNVAAGGGLKLVLYAAGDGVNVNYYRVGEAPAAVAPKDSDGADKGQPTAAEAELEVPATTASYQFRAREAVTAPSPVSATVAPLCGKNPCRVVVRAQAKTMAARVLSLIGAAFPDGGAAPEIHFEI